MKHMIRQGDVLLIPVADQMPIRPAARPAGKVNAHGLLVVAEGETSLHEHTLPAEDALLVEQGDRMLLTLLREQEFAVTHTVTGERLARHTPIRVGPGLYEVRIQRRAEVTPAGMPQRFTRVRD